MTSKAESMRRLVERAFRGAETLPLPDLLALNDAAATALRRFDRPRSSQAAHMAVILRQAMSQQLEFSALLRG